MGRLDDHAKHRIVVLRKAGLSFRKIKKVLELDNIKVTPQAIYLFLKRKKIEPEISIGASQNPTTKGQSWEQANLCSLLQDNGGPKKEEGNQAPKEKRSASDVKEESQETGIKIVNVTSLSSVNQSLAPPISTSRSVPQGQSVQKSRFCPIRPAPNPIVNGPRPSPAQPPSHHPPNGRSRTPLPVLKNPALLVTKKIVDRAISLQKKVILQNGLQLLIQGGHYPPNTSVTNQQAVRPVAQPNPQTKDATTQTASFSPPKTEVSTEQLDSVRGELHRLTQVMQSLIDRQNRWEQEQMRQRQCHHQELLNQIQQLGATLGAKIAQSCAPFTSSQELEASLPDLGHFKMEL
ncbi:uncharacterized protein [Pyxicephalus adspersus]|uniref:Uncharacterized protein n=1 Tax=Pyxicephalus adspersus TaxID=30357 RepID=A0AAV2ZYP5_PYXAD|nr:TPA: hypothetical protein GDO54_015224 [Pyxicephalus adspersus]